MVLDFFRARRGGTVIDEVERTIVVMMRDGRDVFEAATGAVFGGGKSKETKREVKGTDRGINAAQREVRRALMTHSAVAGDIDLPLVLAYMSVVKDVERVGDYSKNMYDLATLGVDFSVAADGEELLKYRDAVAQLISDAADAFEDHNEDRARTLVAKADGFLDEYDDHVFAQARSDGSAYDAVARVLFFRFLKRITAHVMNLMTSMVLPVDQLDYYDEAKDDRDDSASE
jgi:phosphate transport system protein